MSTSSNAVSPEQFAANRANAAKSTGPRTPEGKARSAQNARKHGFAAASYTVVRLEDFQEVANLRDDAVAVYQPVNSQEMFAVERIALTQQCLLRATRLESGLFTSCLNDMLDPMEQLIFPMQNDLVAGIEVATAQNRNFVLAEGLKRLAASSNAFNLYLRYSAQAERQYRRAIDEFDRLKALRPELSGAGLLACVPTDTPNEPSTAAGRAGGDLTPEPTPAPQSEPAAPAAPVDETNRISPEPQQKEWLITVLSPPAPTENEPRDPAGPALAES